MESSGTQEQGRAGEIPTAARALEASRRFLGRFRDRVTRSCADDLAQEAALEAWRGRHRLRRACCWGAFVRTVARRRRSRAVADHLRLEMASIDADPELREQLVVDEPAPRSVHVAGRAVSVEWCVQQIAGVLRGLDPLNERIVRDFYEGFSCRELVERYGVTLDSVKVRLHRSRERIRREFEDRVRRTDGVTGES